MLSSFACSRTVVASIVQALMITSLLISGGCNNGAKESEHEPPDETIDDVIQNSKSKTDKDNRIVTKAHIKLYQQKKDGSFATAEREIADSESLQTLLAMFPKMGTGASSCMAGGWDAAGEIQFQYSNGDVIVVRFDDDCTVWSEGHGDWPLAEGAKELILKLLNLPASERE